MFRQTPILETTFLSPDHTVEMPLEALSERLQLSCQTLVRWVDRHLVEANLGWGLDDEDAEVRMIELTPDALDSLERFAAGYREDVVSCVEARRILKIIDRKQVKKMIRKSDLDAIEVDGERRVLVGSIEDYLIRQEAPALAV